MAAPKRDHLIRTAANVFARDGFHAASVDQIIAEAGVAKMTLYKGLGDKSGLICATISHSGSELRAHIAAYLAAVSQAPQVQLLAVFDAMEDWAERSNFYGCFALNALAEYAGHDGPEAEIARDIKQDMLTYITKLTANCGAQDATGLARTIFMLIDGATAARIALGDRESYAHAREAARQLLHSARP